MFSTIRKHQRWLWVVIIAAIVVSLVTYFSPGHLGGGRGRGDTMVGLLDGRPVGENQLRDAGRQADLTSFLRFGENYKFTRAEQMSLTVKWEAIQRLFRGMHLKDYATQASDAAVATWITETLKDPKTGGVNFDAFLRDVLKSVNFTEGQSFDFVRNDVGMQVLGRLVGAGGQLESPQESAAEIDHTHQRRGADTFRDPAGVPLPKVGRLARIREASVRQRAAQRLGLKAEELPNELYQMEPVSRAVLATMAQKQGLPRGLRSKFLPL